MSATAYANAADKTVLYHHNLNSLADAFATPALGFMNAGLTTMIGLTRAATDLTEHHSLAAKAVSLSIIGVGDAAYYGLKGLSAIGTLGFGLGESIKLIGKFADLESMALRGMYAWDHVTAIASSVRSFASYANLAAGATKLWTGAQWLLNLAMDANPIGLAILGIAALAAGAYEIYERWGAIKNFFKGIWNCIGSINWSGLGITILKNIGEGLLDATGLGAIGRAAEKVAGLIGNYFKGHSPPPLGPLHDLGRVNIIEAIAERIRPGPVISAVGRTAAAIAMAAPMMVASASPAMAGAGSARASAGGITIIDNARITINAASDADKDAFVKALKDHRFELVQQVQRELERRERTKLS